VTQTTPSDGRTEGPGANLSVFDRAVAIQPEGDGRWRAEVESRWNIGSAPNGGYLLSIALAALRQTLPHPDPIAVSAYYAGRISPGHVEISAEAVRSGARHSTGTAWLQQEGERRVIVTATFADLSALEGPTIDLAERPRIPGPDECVPAVGPVAPEFLQHFDMRLTQSIWDLPPPVPEKVRVVVTNPVLPRSIEP
jgi:hypothetical protein